MQSYDIHNNTAKVQIYLAVTERLLFTVSYGIILVGGSVTNLLLVKIILAQKRLRSVPSNQCIVALSMIHIGVCLTNAPYQIFQFNVPGDSVKQSDVMVCKCLMLSSSSTIFMVTSSLSVLSLDRFIAISRPFFYKRFATTRVISYVNMFLVIEAILSSLFTLTLKNSLVHYPYRPGIFCGIEGENLSLVYVSYLSIFHAFVPACIISFCNFQVFKIARSVYCATRNIPRHSFSSRSVKPKTNVEIVKNFECRSNNLSFTGIDATRDKTLIKKWGFSQVNLLHWIRKHSSNQKKYQTHKDKTASKKSMFPKIQKKYHNAGLS